MSLNAVKQSRLLGATFTEPCLEALFAVEQRKGTYLDPVMRGRIEVVRSRPQVRKAEAKKC